MDKKKVCSTTALTDKLKKIRIFNRPLLGEYAYENFCKMRLNDPFCRHFVVGRHDG